MFLLSRRPLQTSRRLVVKDGGIYNRYYLKYCFGRK